jgi:hypothetical protein
MPVIKNKYVCGILLLLLIGLVIKCQDNPSQTKAEWHNIEGQESKYRVVTDKL